MQDQKREKTVKEKISSLYFERIGKYIEPILKAPESKEEQGRIKRAVVRSLQASFVAFLFSTCRINWGARPLGFAFLCASKGMLVPASIGVMAASFLAGNSVLIDLLCCVLSLTVRKTLSKTLTERGKSRSTEPIEPIFVRMALGSVLGFIVGMYSVLAGGFQKPDLYFAISMILVTPVAVWLYDRAINGERLTSAHDAGVLAIMFSLVLSLRGISFIGISPAVVASVFMTLLTSFSGGALRGGITGMICGLGCSLSLCPMLGIAGAVAGMIENKKSLLPVLSFCGVGIAYSVMSEGLLAFSHTLPNLFWGVAVFSPLVKLGLMPAFYRRIAIFGKESTRSAVVSARLLTEARCDSEREARIRGLSDALSSLSSVFYTLSGRLSSPNRHQVREMCERCFKKYCDVCSAASVCWGRDYERTADVISKIASSVAKHGRADTEYIPADFFAKCPNALKAQAELNLTHSRVLEKTARENKTEVFALDYEAMARLLESSCAAVSREFEVDVVLTEKIRRACADINLFADNIAVYGKRRKTVVAGGVDLSGISVSGKEISEIFGAICGTEMSPPEFSLDGDYSVMSCSSAKKLSCKSAKATLKKDEETVNGDCSAVFSGRNDFFYALVSDGMGSGSDAAITSRISCIFLEKMLSAGNRKNIVLRMLNDFLKNKNLECFATVDLLEIDLISAEASFIKGGAACSYVVRGDKLFRISSSSLPIGITREISAEEISLSLKAGDLIVMISDGISQSIEQSTWLADILCSDVKERDIDRLAEQILDTAKEKNQRSDDMTVLAIRVDAA